METINRNSGDSERWKLFAVLAFFLGIVAIPFGKAYWPSERARWLLASADNALENASNENNTRPQAQKLLDEAVKCYPAIEKTLDFARISFRMNPVAIDRAIKLIQSMAPELQPHAANVLAETRLDEGDFASAYSILVAGYPGPTLRSPIQRNQLAYFAALADRDLDVALSDIEKALTESKNASYLDTKAWVLFRLRRYDEALVAIDSAMEELDVELKESSFPSEIQDLLDGKEPFVKRPLDDKSYPLKAFNVAVAQVLKSIVVIHYHRGEILEALKMIEEADQEYTWVQDRGFNDFDRLY